MNSDRQLVPIERLPTVADIDPGTDLAVGGEQRRPSKVLRILRERFILAVILVVLGVAGGGVLGFRNTKPLYKSEGVIDIAPYLTVTIDETSGILPMFNAFIESQAAAIRSSRVLNLAMDSAEWRSTGRGVSPTELARFRGRLKVQHPNETRILVITFMDESALVSQKAVNAVVDAYVEFGKENEVVADRKTISLLQEALEMLEGKLSDVQEEVLEHTKEYGNDAILEGRYQYKSQELLKLDALLNQIQVELVKAEAEQEETSGVDESGKARELTVEEIAVLDEPMRDLIDQRRELQASLNFLKQEKKLGERNEEVLKLKHQIAALDKQINEHAVSFRKLQNVGKVGDKAKIAQLKAQHEELTKQHTEISREVTELSRSTFQVRRLKFREGELRTKIGDVKFRIEKERIEAVFSGRIEVLSRAELPVAPSMDKRKQMAVLGGFLGGSLGVLLVVFVGLLDRRCRTSEDIQESIRRTKLLGLVPSLRTEAEKADNLGLGTHCLHHIRAVLQVGSSLESGQTLAVTSPSAGTGKTTLTAALGFSFSNSGSRTLLIDCDFLAKGLTTLIDRIILKRIENLISHAVSGVSANGNDGQSFDLADVLCCAQDAQNHVTRERLEELMKSSVERLGVNRARELGVFEGLLLVGTRSPTEIEDLPFVRALREVSNRDKGRPLVDPDAGVEQPLGLFAALRGESLDKCVRSTGIPGLSILPLRQTHATSVGKLSPSDLSRVIEEAAARFDTVLVDTGPILGSLEASIVSTKVHGVVVAVSRGEQQNLVERALGHLASLGSNVLGMIFNRARLVDVVRSSRPMSSHREESLL